jgi:thiamine-monophosphate kinase
MSEPPPPAWPPSLDERDIIQALLTDRLPALEGLIRVDAGDDGAVLGDGTVLTHDTMVEGVHWDDHLHPADVGWKLVAVNASDVGAMGGQPLWALLSLCLPRPAPAAWLMGFREGLHEGLRHYGVALIGGDTTRSPGPIIAGLSMGGRVRHPVTRGGARPGDGLWVTGSLGEAAAGFYFGGPGLAALRRPRPPVAFGAALAEAGLATAMMDLSDGLAADLPRLCAASGVGARVSAAALPRGPALQACPDTARPAPLALQVAFGDDYELLLTAPESQAGALLALAHRLGTPLTRIGDITDDGRVNLVDAAWPSPLFSHFSADA